jgi:hypothetical protein
MRHDEITEQRRNTQGKEKIYNDTLDKSKISIYPFLNSAPMEKASPIREPTW